jgi:hypothetical protein
LLLNSDLPIYCALLTSGKFGSERDVLHKEDLERLPIVPLDQLTETQMDRMESLANEALRGDVDWNRIEDFVAHVYGLNKWDREVIHDTLAFSAPFARARRTAQMAPSSSAIVAFARRLAHDLRPFTNNNVTISRAYPRQSVPWVWLSFGSGSDQDMRPLISAADDLGATQIVIVPDEGGIVVGILAQRRYWTSTRARLLALALLHDEAIFQRISGHAAA